MRAISDAERRARLGRQHCLASSARVANPVAAAEAMTVLHATEPATVYLSLQARVEGLSVRDIDTALYDERTLVKQLAMRRTLFVFPRELLPAAWGSASARVATALGKRLVKELETAEIATDGVAWLDEAKLAVLEVLADGEGFTAQEIRERLPVLDERLELAPDTSYATSVTVGPRVLTQLGVEAWIVRGTNTGHWRVSKPRWTRMADWLPEMPGACDAADGYAELVRRWLTTFGPGTETDIVWWLGSTKSAVRAALDRLEAVEVTLDGGSTGWVLPDDSVLDGKVEELEPWAALLPVLDPTVMGWKEREFYLGDHAPRIFDRNGNAGTTAWWSGRVVGCWVQDDAGRVEVRLVEKVPRAASRALDAEAERLSEWLDGTRIGTVYPSEAMKVLDWAQP